MNLHKVLATNNYCYTDLGNMPSIKGIMVHSTGANNPNLRRYVAPDDGLLGTPSSMNWNQRVINGSVHKLGVHAFIGKLKDGTVATYQVQEWNHKCYHCGVGTSGLSGNTNYIAFEICEDGLTDETYFKAVYKEAVELCAFLCTQYNLDPLKNIVCHCEGYELGFASNHADVMHWFKLHGATMDQFRVDVYNEMEDDDMTDEKFASMMETWLNNRAKMAGSTSDEFVAAQTKAKSKGFMVGNQNGDMMWKSYLTREQFVLVLDRAGLLDILDKANQDL